jgi:hypothetical protein
MDFFAALFVTYAGEKLLDRLMFSKTLPDELRQRPAGSAVLLRCVMRPTRFTSSTNLYMGWLASLTARRLRAPARVVPPPKVRSPRRPL